MTVLKCWCFTADVCELHLHFWGDYPVCPQIKMYICSLTFKIYSEDKKCESYSGKYIIHDVVKDGYARWPSTKNSDIK